MTEIRLRFHLSTLRRALYKGGALTVTDCVFDGMRADFEKERRNGQLNLWACCGSIDDTTEKGKEDAKKELEEYEAAEEANRKACEDVRLGGWCV